jgi:hypothetical protein
MLKKNRLLCIDLQTLLQSDPLPVAGKPYLGILRCKTPSEGCLYANEFVFVEDSHKKKVKTLRRTPIIYSGNCINVHRCSDGTLRLDFNRPRLDSDFSFRDFCMAAAQELLTISRLLGEE